MGELIATVLVGRGENPRTAERLETADESATAGADESAMLLEERCELEVIVGISRGW